MAPQAVAVSRRGPLSKGQRSVADIGAREMLLRFATFCYEQNALSA